MSQSFWTQNGFCWPTRDQTQLKQIADKVSTSKIQWPKNCSAFKNLRNDILLDQFPIVQTKLEFKFDFFFATEFWTSLVDFPLR